MKTNAGLTGTLTLLFMLFVGAPTAADEIQAEESQTAIPTSILITFVNDAAKNSHVPGRSYRYRSRYQISAAARRYAKAIAEEYKLTALEDWPIKSLNVYCVVFDLSDSEPLASLIARLHDDPRVESVQAMRHFKGMASSTAEYNDIYAGFQHGLRSMDILQAHQFARGDGVKIAVIDTNIDRHHEDLSNNDIQVRNFVSDEQDLSATEHGTAVVSVIGANSNNHKGIVGVAPGAELIAISACWAESKLQTAQCDSFTLAKAMDYIIQSPPDVLNLSIAGPHDALLGRLIDAALQKGTVIVAALPKSSDKSNVYPARFPGVIAIRSAPPVTANNAGPMSLTDELLAPGEQIMVALPDDLYDFRSGSSLATANASGVIALLLEHAPDLDSDRIVDILQKSQTENVTGSTVINACRALAEIGALGTCL